MYKSENHQDYSINKDHWKINTTLFFKRGMNIENKDNTKNY